MRAGDIRKGDLMIFVALPVKSVMVQGDTVMLFWGDERQMDAVSVNDDVSAYPATCRACGTRLVEEYDDE